MRFHRCIHILRIQRRRILVDWRDALSRLGWRFCLSLQTERAQERDDKKEWFHDFWNETNSPVILMPIRRPKRSSVEQLPTAKAKKKSWQRLLIALQFLRKQTRVPAGR